MTTNRQKVLELHALGYKDRYIARTLHITPERVRQIRVKLKLPAIHEQYAKVCFCGSKARCKGMCDKHYQNARKYGDPCATIATFNPPHIPLCVSNAHGLPINPEHKLAPLDTTIQLDIPSALQ